MEAIGLAAGIVQLVGLTTKTIKYLNSVKHSSEERTKLFREVSSLLPLLVTLQTQVDQSSGSEPWSQAIRSLGVENGPIDQLRNALQQLTKRLKPKKGIGGATSAIVWDLNKSSCLALLDTIERTKSRVTLALHGDTLKLTQAIKEDTARIGTIDDRVSTLSLGIDGLHQKCDFEKRRTILEWLSPLNFYRVQQDISARREADTGQWFLDAPEFQEWTYGANNTLCCPGIPGAGKSVLASLAVDFLRRLPSEHSPTGVAAVYCNFKDQEQQTLENLIASVCVQLLHESPTLPAKVMDLYKTCSSKGIRPGLQEILQVFQDAVNACGCVYLVVDALDECMEEVRNGLISKVNAIPLNLKLLVTTRYIDSIMNRFTGSPQLRVLADSGDMNKYIRAKIQKLAVQVQPQLADEICHSIIAQADGMFLAAKLHVDSLATKASVKTLKQAVKNLPGTLNDLYDSVMQRIRTTLSPEFRTLAEKALHWVAFTYRPLPVHTLLVALAIEPGNKVFDPDGCPSLSLVLDICTGLLIFDEQSEVIRLVHYTLQDYFDTLPLARNKIVHRFITRTCMTYMDFGCVQGHIIELEEESKESSSEDNNDGVESEKDDKDKGLEDCYRSYDIITRSNTRYESCKLFGPDEHRQLHSLLAYVSGFWSLHAKAGSDVDLWNEIHNFLACGRRIRLQSPSAYDPTEPFGPPNYYSLTFCHGLGIAAFFGLCGVLERLLQETDNIDEPTSHEFWNSLQLPGRRFSSALHLAALNDQLAAVEMLLEHGAKINCEDTDGNTPLHYAIISKSQSAASALVTRGADVAARHRLQFCIWYSETDAKSSTPLGLVEWDAPLRFLQLLLDAGACITPQDVFHESPLMVALIKRNDLETAKWLFKRLARPKRGTERYPSEALVQATYEGSAAFMRLLLEYGADINSKKDSYIDTRWNTALHGAVVRSDEVKVKLLLDGGIDTETLNYPRRKTALHIAAGKGFVAIAKLLLEYHAAVDGPSGSGQTPLMLTTWSDSTSLAELLLRLGANANARDDNGASALHLSAARRNTLLVRKLIEGGADIDQRSLFNLTADYYTGKTKFWYGRYDIIVLNETGEVATLLFAPSIRGYLRFHPEGPFHKCKLWKGGMTALDIAEFTKNEEIIDLLKPRTTAVTEIVKTTWEEYLGSEEVGGEGAGEGAGAMLN